MRVGPLLCLGLALAWVAGCGGRTLPCSDTESCDPVASGPGDGSTRSAQIALGWAHTCAVDGAGTVRCFGSNANGQLGNGEATGYPTDGVPQPIVVMLGEPAQRIAAGGSHTCALASGVACWGNDGSGDLGPAATADKVVPTPVAGLDGGRVISVHVGASSNACALFDDGTARCWGSNESGQIAPGSSTPYFAVAMAAPIVGIRELALGGTFTCALTTEGAVSCWGCTWKAEGGNDYCTSPEPAVVAEVSEARAIAAGRGHACALRADGTVWCWGLNTWRQLGDGTGITRAAAAPVIGVAGVEQIALGWDHSCAITGEHEAICWGANDHGAIGSGEDGAPSEPAQVLGGVKAIAGGGGHTCALREDGSTWCWGWNPYGQIGDGTRVDRLVPVQIPPE